MHRTAIVPLVILASTLCLGSSSSAQLVWSPQEVFAPVESDVAIAEPPDALELCAYTQNQSDSSTPVAAADTAQVGLATNVQPFLLDEFRPPTGLILANNFNVAPDFANGIIVTGADVALKIGGYVKADLIHDFNPIGSTDFFDTTTIPTSGPNHQNTRFHARQTRLSFDTRWRVDDQIIRAYVEGDFFGGDPNGPAEFRLRHAYGRLGRFMAGQTWTTFTDPSAVPQTLDREGSASNVNRRQGLVRWDQPILVDGLTFALAIEDPRIIIEAPPTVLGQGRTESPDFITRLRYESDRAEFQSAFVLRKLGFQPVDQSVISRMAWGFNFTGAALVLDKTKAYYQITFGDGIGSYRGSPDVVATGPTSAAILPMFGWMVGVHHEWNDRLTSNVTFSQLALADVAGQDPDNLKDTTYLAVNLIANPYERVFCGIEYLYGIRDDVSGASGTDHRLQTSFGFYLP